MLKKKVYNKRARVGPFLIAVIVLICAVHGIRSCYVVDYYPMNGTFQNYNPVRRWLSGQIPFRDFKIYLGLGHLYLGGFFTWIFGNDFAANLVAFSFLSLLSLAIISFAIGEAVFESSIKAGAVTAILLVILLQISDGAVNIAILTEIKSSLMAALSPGNSARYIRGMITGISVILFLLLGRWMRGDLRKERIKRAIIVSVVSGICFLWSNDYGISCWLCLIIMVFIVSMSRNGVKHACFASLFYVAGSFLAVYVLAQIYTAGHFKDWLNTTFGAGDYQKWYYLSAKSYFMGC